jgi:peptidoglycan/xylan/chitin deacetylase (PgdA/CDA1 family)
VTIRERILVYIAAFLYYSGLIHVIHWLHRHSGNRLIIVNYHQASGGELRRHLLYLNKYFRLQFVGQALEALYSQDKASGKDQRLPLAVTFDDGYIDNYTDAYKLAHELQIPITIFLITSYIENGAAYWWLDNLVQKAQVDQVTIDGHTYYLNKLDEQQELAQLIDTQMSSESDKEARQAYLIKMSKMLSAPVPALPEIDEESMPMLTWEQIQEMQASGWVAFEGHTHHHPILAGLTDADEACKEVITCRSLVQEKVGQSGLVFAYPHGGIEHIGTNGLLAVQRAGYRWALTTVPGANTARTHPYLIRRVSATSQTHWLIIVLMTSGIWDFLAHFNWLIKRIKRRKILKMMGLPYFWVWLIFLLGLGLNLVNASIL